jgi:CO/xanthine dehydrogenase Mo-binding subunit
LRAESDGKEPESRAAFLQEFFGHAPAGLAEPLGSGEGSQGPMVGAIANAFAHATGKRLRDLPFTPERVRTTLG